MPKVVDYGNKVAEGIGAGLAGAGMATEFNRQQEIEAEEAAQREQFNQARIAGLDLQAQGMQGELDELELVQEQRKEMAARIQGLVDDGLYGDPKDAEGMAAQIGALIPGIISGEVDPNEILGLTKQAQADAKRIATPKQQRGNAVGQITDMLANDPNNEELLSILLDVQTGAKEPGMGRMEAMVLTGKLEGEVEALVQERAEAIVAGMFPDRSPEYDAARTVLDPEVEEMGDTLRSIEDMGEGPRQELMTKIVDAMEAGQGPVEVFRNAITAGINPDGVAFTTAIRDEKLKRTQRKRKTGKERKKAVGDLRSAAAREVKLRGEGLTTAKLEERLRDWATEAVPDITEGEITAILRTSGAKGERITQSEGSGASGFPLSGRGAKDAPPAERSAGSGASGFPKTKPRAAPLSREAQQAAKDTREKADKQAVLDRRVRAEASESGEKRNDKLRKEASKNLQKQWTDLQRRIERDKGPESPEEKARRYAKELDIDLSSKEAMRDFMEWSGVGVRPAGGRLREQQGYRSDS